MQLDQNRIRAVIFDWAGTMVDFGSRAPAAVFQEVFKRCGVEITTAQAREPMGMAKREHIAAILKMSDVAAAWYAENGKQAEEQDIDQIYADFLPLQKEVLEGHCDMIPGAVDTFLWCRDNQIKVGSSTGYTKELMEIVIPRAKEAGYDPEVILCAEDSHKGRPAPWLIFECAKRLDVFPVKNILKVDDTIAGIEAGVNAGVWTVGVIETGNMLGFSQQELAALHVPEKQRLIELASQKMRDVGADFVVAGVQDIPEIITEIDRKLTLE